MKEKSSKRKVCVVVTARPSYSRIKTALQAIREHSDLDLQLVIAASALLNRYGSVVEQIESDGFKIDAKVFIVFEGENPTSMAKTTGIGVMELSTTFFNLQPDVVVSIADRYETIATTIAAAYMNIPVAHIQGGEVTGSIDEKVRHANTKLADIHLVASEQAKERVIKLGELPEMVFNTGCPSIDLAAEINISPGFDYSPMEKYSGVGEEQDLSSGYVVVMQHPVTSEYSDARMHVEETLSAVQELDRSILWFWPNVDSGADGTSSGIRTFRETRNTTRFHFFKNMAPKDFLRLLVNSDCLIGNSSVGIRECAYLGVPVVNIGSRQSGRQRGCNVIDVDYNQREILEASRQHINRKQRFTMDPIYGDGTAGRQIAEILASCKLVIEKKITY